MNQSIIHSQKTVPHLTTALRGPLLQLEKHILQHQSLIEAWLRDQWVKTPPPLNCSVDIRNAGFKLSAVDTNLFPAGFNNLNEAFLPLAIQAMQITLSQFTHCKRILIIPESHTRNPFYFKNLARLQEIILKAGYQVRFGSLISGLTSVQTVEVDESHSIQLEPLKRQGARLELEGFNPCLIYLNNDFSEGVPELLKGIEQPIYPPLNMAWATRSKAHHGHHLEEICVELATLIGLDPWLIHPISSFCSGVNFLKREGEECLIAHAQDILSATEKKYQEYGIKEKPFVVIKADAGTYGMDVLMIRTAEEIKQLNRKQRTSMAVSKGSQPITKVVLQEGVYSFETWGSEHFVAEPVVYMLGQYVIGGFYRVHKNRGSDENLNAPGMHFEPLAFASSCNTPDLKNCSNDEVNRFYMYGVIARLAALGAGREQVDTKEKR